MPKPAAKKPAVEARALMEGQQQQPAEQPRGVPMVALDLATVAKLEKFIRRLPTFNVDDAIEILAALKTAPRGNFEIRGGNGQ